MTEETKTITIIGAGFTGSTIAVQQAQHYERLIAEGHDLPKLTIRLIDSSGAFGPGLPYNTDDDVFLVNQPADAMSPFPDDPGHFTRWRGGSGNDFATRREYGRYLKETLQTAFNDAAVTLETVSARVTSITPNAHGFTLNDALETDALILASGHHALDTPREPGHFAGPFSVATVRETLKDATKDDHVAIVGTGQSMLDALAALDHVGFPGTVHAFSRHLVTPWAYRPENYAPDRAQFKIAPFEDLSAQGLTDHFTHECERAATLGYDTGHLLAAVDFTALAKACASEDLASFRAHWSRVYSNPTPPKRYDLFCRWRDSGHLQLHREDVNAIAHDDAGFHVGSLSNLKAVFNAAAFSRDPLADPLLKNAADQGLLAFTGRAVSAGVQAHPALFAAGPATSPDKWGVETFRDNNAAVARLSVEEIFKTQLQTPTKGTTHDHPRTAIQGRARRL